MGGEGSDLIGANGGVDGGLNGNGSGEWEHERGWVGEIVGESEYCLWQTVLIGSKKPLLLLKMNNV